MNTTLTTRRAVGYLRVSTPGQAGNEHNSLETQEGRYKEYCQRNDLLPVCHFVDVVSATGLEATGEDESGESVVQVVEI